MRVTNAAQTRSLISQMQNAQQALVAAQQRATSGKKVERMSDDPASGAVIMWNSSGLRAIEQHRRNVSAAVRRLDAEDNALVQVTDLMTRARELGTAGASDNLGTEERRAAGRELREIVLQMVSVGNTQIGGEYLFGGLNTGTVPLDAARAAEQPYPFATLNQAGTQPAAQGERSVEVAAGQVVPTAHDAKTVFLDSNALVALQRLADALDPAGAPPGYVPPPDQRVEIHAATVDVSRAFDRVQGVVGELGARQNRADIVRNSLDGLEAALTQQKSELGEVDMEQAITEMLARQTAYQAAMMASSKVMGLSLLDYLR